MTPTLLIRGERRIIDTTLVMGVVNASPDSFSDAGRFQTLSQRLELAASLVEAGADIVDVGGQSAITNQPEIDPKSEIDRVVPIIEFLHSAYPGVVVSVDTYKPEVVEASLSAGASMLNDVSGLLYPEVVDTCIAHEAALVIMHTAARPKARLQDKDRYSDVASEVVDFLRDKLAIAVSLGLPEESVILDPGPDFAKTPHQTVEVLRRVHEIRTFKRPLLLALSRKDFLGAITGRTPRAREAATHAAIAHFASVPGNIVRVHDVVAARDAIATVEALAGLRDVPPDYILPDALRHEPVS